MAFPTIIGTSGDNSGANVTESGILLPDGCNVVGRLVLVLFGKDGAVNPPWPAGWLSLWERDAVGISGSGRYRVIDGSEGFDGIGDTIALTHELEGSAYNCYLIGNHGSAVRPPTVSPIQAGSGSSPNPPLCDPGAAKDYLWIAVSAYDGDVSLSAIPAGFTDLLQHRWAHAEGVGVGSARRFLNAASLDPSVFTKSGSGGSITCLIAIHPTLTALEKARLRQRMTVAEATEVRDLSARTGKGAWISPHTKASHRADVLANPSNPPDETSRRLGCATDLNTLIPMPPPPVKQSTVLCGVTVEYAPPGFVVDAPFVAPVADFTLAIANLVVTGTDTSTDADGTIDGWDWDWGDGTAHSTTQNAEHTYAEAGTYTITLTVTNDDELTDAEVRSITVAAQQNTPPIADFILQVNVGGQGRTIACTDTSTDPGGSIASRAWTFGDGGTSTETNPVHAYAVAGTYTVTLTVTDNGGLTNERSREITVPVITSEGVVIPPEIDATGATDVTVPLQAFFDEQSNGARILGPAGAIYRPEFGIVLFNRFGLTLEAIDPENPPTFIQTNLRPYGFNPDGSSHKENRNRLILDWRLGGGHTFRNWRLHGAQPNSGVAFPFVAELEAQHGLVIAGVEGMLVENPFVTEVAGDFVLLNDPVISGVRHQTRDITIKGLVGRKCARQAITPTGATNCLIEDFDLEDINRSVFDFEPPGASTMVNITIQNGRVANYGNHLVAGAGNASAVVDNIIVQDIEVIGRLPVIMWRGFRTYSVPGTPPHLRRSRLYMRRINAHSIPALASNPTIVEFSACDEVECTDITVAVPAGTLRPGVGVSFDETCGITYGGCTWGGADNDHEVTTSYNIVAVNVAVSDPPLELGAISVPLDTALTGPIPNGTKITFPSGHFVRTDANHQVGATSLVVRPLTTLVDGADAGEYATPVRTLDGVNLEWAGRPGFPGCA